MLKKTGLYFWTIYYLKPAQVFWRIGSKMGIKCALKGASPSRGNGQRVTVPIPELDYDPAFLARFRVEELMADRICFLHEAEQFDWDGIWHADGRSHLWNFNLHYFEYIHPLTHHYQKTGDKAVLDKTVQMICGWIRQNSRGKGGDGWAAYTVSLRLTNWLAYIAQVGDELTAPFREELERSIWEQYVYLSEHLEKHILGNHYFENLKALVLCGLFFGDTQNLPIYLDAFRKECREEILADGMHFELSPMYHKIVLEGILRVTAALRAADSPDPRLEKLARQMLSASWSLERGLCRTPLFNDSGDNVSKSLSGLLDCAARHLGITPTERSSFPESGYYIFRNGLWKLIVDAGAPGPGYIPGHSHCDAMSFELFQDGEPVLVNCGTFAYQCPERLWFRSTQAHNTVQAAGVEQSEIWSTFRLARRSRTDVLRLLDHGIQMEMTDYKGNRISRELRLEEERLYILDQAEGLRIRSYLHSVKEIHVSSSAELERSEAMYAPEYGMLQTVHQITASGNGSVEMAIPLR